MDKDSQVDAKIKIPGFAGKHSEGNRHSSKSTKHFEAIINSWNILDVFQIAQHLIKVPENARLVHLVFSAATMCVAVVLWHSQLAHFAFVCAIGLSTVKPLAIIYGAKQSCLICLFGFRMALHCQHLFPWQRSREWSCSISSILQSMKLRNAGEFYFDVISSKYEEAAANSKIPASCIILVRVATIHELSGHRYAREEWFMLGPLIPLKKVSYMIARVEITDIWGRTTGLCGVSSCILL